MRNKRYLLSLVASFALTLAKLSTGIACLGLFYQPKMPQQLKKKVN